MNNLIKTSHAFIIIISLFLASLNIIFWSSEQLSIVAKNIPIESIKQTAAVSDFDGDLVLHESFDSGDIAGAIGQAKTFDGVDDYIDKGNNSWFSQEFSISSWFKTNSSGSKVILSKLSGDSDWQFSFNVLADGKIYFKLYGTNSSSDQRSWSTNTGGFNDDVWHHAVVTINDTGAGISKNIKFYVDGILKSNSVADSQGNQSAPYTVKPSPINIGARFTPTLGLPFNGALDDIRIYDDVLSSSQINELYALGGGNPAEADTTPPSVPTGLTAIPFSSSQINLSWTASTDNTSVSGYRIYRNGTQITTTSNTSYSNTGLSASTAYTYTIASYDDASNISAQSASVSATTPAGSGPPINGQCSTVTNTCVSPTPATNIRTDAVNNLWTCPESNGGNPASCSSPIITGSTQPTVSGNEVTAYSCEQADVQAAVNIISDGNILNIPAGNCSWDRTVNINLITNPKSLTIKGAGDKATILRDNINKNNPNSSSEAMFNVATALGKSFRLTNLEIRPQRATEYANGAAIVIGGTSEAVRIDNIEVDDIQNRAIRINGSVLGVVDHSTFNYFRQPILVTTGGLFGKSWGDGSYENPVDWGGRGAFYIENNTFKSRADAWLGALDAWDGSRIVFRYNNLENSGVTFHGTETGQRSRGGRSMEVYGNTLKMTRSRDTLIDLRSASALIFNNTFDIQGGISVNSAIKLNSYRLQGGYPPWGIADGTKAWDTPLLADGASTPGGAGDGVYENGVSSGAGAGIVSDSSKSWNTNQWVQYSVRQFARFTATGGGSRRIVVSGAGWSNNQWAGFEVTRLSDNSKSYVYRSTSDTLMLDDQYGSSGYYNINMSSGEFELSKAGLIENNTANSLNTYQDPDNHEIVFRSGLNYEIRKVDMVLDDPGRGRTNAFTGSSPYNHQNINQSLDPVFQWNNLRNNATVNASIAHQTIVNGRNYFNNTCPSFNYTPYTYPHPLTEPTSSSIPPLNCPGSPDPVPGICSTSLNICTSGRFTDESDTATQYKWSCQGINSNTNANCSLPIPVIVSTPAQCSTTINSCSTGTLRSGSQSSNSTHNLWTCDGLNGGAQASCSILKALPPTPGQCSTTLNLCTSGNPEGITANTTHNIWTCGGINGGEAISCSKLISNIDLTPTTNLVTVNKTGSGVGTVSGTGISCGSDCTHVLPINTAITLTATPNSGYVFSSWSGGYCSGSNNTCTITPTTDATVIARFSVIPTAVNGLCSTTLNSCTTGRFSERSDNTTHSLWSCQGTNGGTSVDCSSIKPAVPPPPVYNPPVQPVNYTPTPYVYKKPVTTPKLIQPTPDLPPSPSFEPLDFIPTDYIKILLDLTKDLVLNFVQRITRGAQKVIEEIKMLSS